MPKKLEASNKLETWMHMIIIGWLASYKKNVILNTQWKLSTYFIYCKFFFVENKLLMD